MFIIQRLKSEVLTDKSIDITDLYGFDFNFDQGLNIIAGPNSRGKTTINTCIYYALGMEELLGAHNEKALDKALKQEFVIKPNDDEENYYRVLSSKILLEVKNDNNKVVTLERYIKSSSSEFKTSNINVYNGSIADLSKEDYDLNLEIFYVNGEGNNDGLNGFYNWFSEFINIELPEVSNSSRTSNYSPLYLQTIFSALFIEQTKGWSDFFATMPFFGITKAKEKIVEFLLNLNEIKLSTKKDILSKEKSFLTEEWRKKIRAFSYLERKNNSTIINVPGELTTDKTLIEKITGQFAVSETDKININQFLELKSEHVRDLEQRPLSTIRENREIALATFNKEKEDYYKLQEYIERFENKLRVDSQQSVILISQLKTVESEIKDHNNLKKVFNENIISERGANQCPTCSQEVTVDLISTKNIKIPQLTLEENTNFLKGQKKIIESSMGSLKETLEEKNNLLLYFKNTLRQKEILLKSLSKDLISDDRAFSESEVVKKLQIEREIEDVRIYQDAIDELKEELKVLANKYLNNTIEFGKLGESELEDETKLSSFEDKYKDFLFNFGYESNVRYQISINRKEPFKYFPVYKNHSNDPIPQSIRINSSASDFVRNIWAYTLALLKNGENTPGIIMFDEPGQHRTNLNSLKALFKACSDISDKQSIIFTSIDKPLGNEENEKIDLDILIEDLDVNKYKLIRLDDTLKVIQKLG